MAVKAGPIIYTYYSKRLGLELVGPNSVVAAYKNELTQAHAEVMLWKRDRLIKRDIEFFEKWKKEPGFK